MLLGSDTRVLHEHEDAWAVDFELLTLVFVSSASRFFGVGAPLAASERHARTRDARRGDSGRVPAERAARESRDALGRERRRAAARARCSLLEPRAAARNPPLELEAEAAASRVIKIRRALRLTERQITLRVQAMTFNFHFS